MIRLVCRETAYAYDAFHLVKAFFPGEEVTQIIDETQEPLIFICMEDGSCLRNGDEENLKIVCQIFSQEGEKKKDVTRRLYQELSGISARELPWGILTGVRPTKLCMSRVEMGDTPEEAAKWMQDTYFVSEEKAKLGTEIAIRENALLQQLDYENGYSLYVGIPFCPSICAYCSFSSSPIDQWKDKTESYLSALFKELTYIGKAAKEKTLDTIYMGGGTPTTLTADQLDRLLTHMEETFSYDAVKEVTVEAGRPDSITEDKLKVLKNHKVTRISINPQTMQQKTLDIIGRRHTVEEVKSAFSMARNMGFDNINMDLIAGLPGETLQDMEDTLRQVRELGPDSLTVHSLAVKRAALYGQNPIEPIPPDEMHRMIEAAGACADEMDLLPYYLYRQKNMAGNFENVGYAKVDKAGIYNILIMEEKQTILAAGAGASTKIVLPEPIVKKDGKKTNLIRVENVKNVLEYIDRIDEMIQRKEELLWR